MSSPQQETIVDALKRALGLLQNPSTADEIFEKIIEDGLYVFHADDPRHVAISQLRRHTLGLEFASASRTKHFKLRDDNRFEVLPSPIISSSSNSQIVGYSATPQPISKSLIQRIKSLLRENEDTTRRKLLNGLKRLTPASFEKLSKRILEVYGFSKMRVTRLSQDGGIDGNGALRVGLADLRVAFQCKRWTSNSVGRVEIDRFRGAIQGEFDQGVFFTTSHFASGAIKASYRRGAVPIVLIDGKGLVDLMMQKLVGVQRESVHLYTYALDLALEDDDGEPGE